MEKKHTVKLGMFVLIFFGALSIVYYYKNQNIPNIGEKKGEIISNRSIFESEKTVSAEIPIIKVDKDIVYYPEFEFYLLATKKDFEASLGNEVWEVVKNGRSLEEELKTDIIEEIARLKIIVNEAKKEECSLDKDEIEEIKKTVKEQLKGIDPLLKAKYYLDEKLITNIYIENYLATKFFDEYAKKRGTSREDARKLFKESYNSWENSYTAEIYWENIDKIKVSELDLIGPMTK